MPSGRGPETFRSPSFRLHAGGIILGRVNFLEDIVASPLQAAEFEIDRPEQRYVLPFHDLGLDDRKRVAAAPLPVKLGRQIDEARSGRRSGDASHGALGAPREETAVSNTTSVRHETRTISIPSSGEILHGDLTLPAGARGLVIFVHGSGSSRLSPRNQMVARRLQDAGLGTLLFDLLSPYEEGLDAAGRQLRFDIGFLAERLARATEWIASGLPDSQLRVGFFGASTGTAAALVAAADHPGLVSAIVSRGGRPDLAGPALRRITVPTLLVVGGADTTVLALNRRALTELGSRAKELTVVPGASHLFEEAGALDQVADMATRWFERHLAPPL